MAGVKGRSGRRSHIKEVEQAKLINLAGHTIYLYLSDPQVSLEKKALISVPVYTKAIKQVTATELTLVPYEQSIIDKYSKPLIDSKLDMITGTTAGESDVGVG